MASYEVKHRSAIFVPYRIDDVQLMISGPMAIFRDIDGVVKLAIRMDGLEDNDPCKIDRIEEPPRPESGLIHESTWGKDGEVFPTESGKKPVEEYGKRLDSILDTHGGTFPASAFTELNNLAREMIGTTDAKP